MNLPLGFRFQPRDDEIIKILGSMLAGIPVPGATDFVFDWDLFDKKAPWELFDNIDTDATVGYFITPLRRKSANGKNVNRVVENIGTWNGETKAESIYDPHTNALIGTKKYFTFRLDDPERSSGKRKRSAQDGLIWTMYEYVLEGEKPDVSLCRIKKKPVNKNSKKDQEEVLLKSPAASDSLPSTSSGKELYSSNPPQLQNNNSTTHSVLNNEGYSISTTSDDLRNSDITNPHPSFQISYSCDPPQFQNNNTTTHSVLESEGNTTSETTDDFWNFDVNDPHTSLPVKDAYSWYPQQFQNNNSTTHSVINGDGY